MKNNSSCFFMCPPPLPYVLRTSPLHSGNTGYCSCSHTPVFTPHLRHCRPLSNRESGKATDLIPKRIKKKCSSTNLLLPGETHQLWPCQQAQVSICGQNTSSFPHSSRPLVLFMLSMRRESGTFFKLGFGNSMCMKFREY